MMNDVIQTAVNDYVELVGMTHSRRAENMKKKAALICSMSRVLGMSDSEVGRYVNASRSAVLYHRRRHETNKLSWTGYPAMYNLAKEAIKKVVEDDVQSELKIEGLINQLHQMKSHTRSIDEQLTLIAAIQTIKKLNK